LFLSALAGIFVKNMAVDLALIILDIACFGIIVWNSLSKETKEEVETGKTPECQDDKIKSDFKTIMPDIATEVYDCSRIEIASLEATHTANMLKESILAISNAEEEFMLP
jgi:hypothetical protein